MKKKYRILIIILLILIILLISIYVVHQNKALSKMPHVTGIIVSKKEYNGKYEILIKKNVEVTEISYEIRLEKKPIVKNINGKRISIDKLNIGDTINITYEECIYVTRSRLENVKLIQVTEDNSDGHMSEEDLKYHAFYVSFMSFTKDSISFWIERGDKELPDDLLSTNCKIVKKIENSKYMDIKYIESSAISYENKKSNTDAKILINIPDFRNELEIGDYILVFDNPQIGLIRLPFLINERGYPQLR